MLNDSTINQHFISQVELRLNTSTPSQANRNNCKIYTFDVDQKSNGERVFSPKNERICKTLFVEDLFTVDKSSSFRHNYESLFGRYEEKLSEQMERFKAKIDSNNNDIVEELFSITMLKLLNSFRNPFSIKKTLNTIGLLGNYHPTDPSLYKDYSRILDGNKPQIKRITQLFDVNEDEYKKWLRCLFMLLAVKPNGSTNFIEDILTRLLLNEDSGACFILFKYTSKDLGIAISDRGIIERANNSDMMSFDMNLDACTFMRFGHVNLTKVLPKGMPDKVIQHYKKYKRDINLIVIENNIDELMNYNQCAVLQSARKVYCAQPLIHGVDIIPKD